MTAVGPIVHQPFVFHVGSFALTGFGIAVALAFLVVAAMVGFVVGAKLYAVALNRTWDVLFSRGNFVFWGGLIGGIAASWLVLRWRRVPFLRMADVAGPAIAAGYAIGRTGCWAVGDDYGRPWTGPLAVAFPRGAPPSTVEVLARDYGASVPAGLAPNVVLSVHPTQLYEVAMGLVMFAVLWRLRDHRHAEGWLFGVYCVLAGIERFVVEFYRAKDDRFVGPLTTAQVLALGFVVAGAILVVRRREVGPRAPGVYAAA